MARRLDSLRITLEVNLIRLANHKKAAPAAEIKQTPLKIMPVKEKPAVKEVRAEEIKSEPPEPVINITLEDIKNAWQNVIDGLSRVKMSVSTYLSEGEPINLKGNQLIVSFAKSHSLHKETLEGRENKEIIEQGLHEALNARLRVSFILSAETKPREAEDSGTFVQSILDTFHGRLIKES